MGNSAEARNDAVNGVGINANANWIGLHSADPGTTGASEITGGLYQRVSVSFPVAAGGQASSTTAVINVPVGQKITHWSRSKQQTGPTFYQGFALPAEELFASGGTYSLAILLQQPVQ